MTCPGEASRNGQKCISQNVSNIVDKKSMKALSFEADSREADASNEIMYERHRMGGIYYHTYAGKLEATRRGIFEAYSWSLGGIVREMAPVAYYSSLLRRRVK